ncbi:MAG TPA: ABC transporter ATP-binding protein [Puia sp.]|nr:ABC transporter ATP-binding protein [Puia sp.]
MSTSAIAIRSLSFSYPKQEGVQFEEFSLDVPDGMRFGLLGPNGAGKTTLMKLMTGLLKYKKGSIRLLEHEMNDHPKSVNKLFGFVPQDYSFYAELSPRENLAFFGAWYGLSKTEIKKRSAELLEILGLTDVKDRYLHTFSGGMKRRVNLAIGVLHRPRVLFLDEPTVGVDVQSRHAMIQYLKELNRQGTTLIYTSHQLEEAEGLCEKIALMDDGKIIAHDQLATLLKEHRQDGLEGLFLELTGKRFRD